MPDSLVGDVHGDIAAPALGAVKGDDADRLGILAREQVPDQGLAISVFLVTRTPTSPPPSKILKHEVSILLRPMGCGG
jgi:hypothetical protein